MSLQSSPLYLQQAKDQKEVPGERKPMQQNLLVQTLRTAHSAYPSPPTSRWPRRSCVRRFLDLLLSPRSPACQATEHACAYLHAFLSHDRWNSLLETLRLRSTELCSHSRTARLLAHGGRDSIATDLLAPLRSIPLYAADATSSRRGPECSFSCSVSKMWSSLRHLLQQ